MLNIAESCDASLDSLEQELLSCEALIGTLRRRQSQVLAALDEAQVHAADGSRSMTEWVAARLDIGTETARLLMRAAAALSEHPESDMRLADGEISFERAVATAGLAATGASQRTLERSFGLDLSGVARLASRHRRISGTEERSIFERRFLAIQPSLDDSAWRLWGELPAVDGRVVEEALVRRAEELPRPPDGTGPTSSTRRADALVSIARDSIETKNGREPTVPVVTVFVDGDLADGTAGESGGAIAFGPRVGPMALERLLCEGSVGVVVTGGPSVSAHSAAARTLKPAMRRYVLWRDGGCVIDGCRSRYRLQPHHVVLRSEGGSHDPANLATLCWYHHHVAIHGLGFRLDPDSPSGRRRLLQPDRGRDPPG